MSAVAATAAAASSPRASMSMPRPSLFAPGKYAPVDSRVGHKSLSVHACFHSCIHLAFGCCCLTFLAFFLPSVSQFSKLLR